MLFIVLHKLTELEMKVKLSVVGVILILMISSYLFESSNSRQTQKKQEILFAFNHHKDLNCSGKVVNKKLYNYASRSFIGKKGSAVFASPNIPISECSVKP